MDGTPVWLASLSRRSPITDRFRATTKWTAGERAAGEGILREWLAGLGDPARERLFRMQVTLCLHRAIGPREGEAMPAWFWAAPAVGLAGGPVEILWENTPGGPSTQPCAHPTRHPFPGERWDPDLWIPEDCGACPSCLARTRIEEGAPLAQS